jgi:nifR3 family TIM-barrel protein
MGILPSGPATASPGADSAGQPKPAFWVRDLPIYGDLVLAPMAGFSDQPYRSLCRRFGSAMSYTELVSADGILYQSPRTLSMLAFDPAERPVVFQLFGHDEDQLEAAARRLLPLNPDLLDLNLGCSVAKVFGKGAGASLLGDPAKIGRIMARLVHAVSIPVTAKIRLGPDRHALTYLTVARALEENGAALIAVHGRTRAQSYAEPANWDAIAEVKQAVSVPVLGNGDVHCVADIERLKRHTHCDGVMVARAAIGNPWLFQRRDLNDVPWAERRAVMEYHLAEMTAFYGPQRGLVKFRKHAVRYLRGLPLEAAFRTRLTTCDHPEEFLALLAQIKP